MKLSAKAFAKLAVAVAVVALALSACKKNTSQLEEDVDAIKAYLAANGINAQDTNKVYYQVITEGTGEQCAAGDTVAIKYKVATIDRPDAIFDQNEGNKATVFFLPSTLGSTSATGAPIYGLQFGLVTMKENGVSKFYVPSSYAYGSQRIGPDSIAYANLVFEVELCEIIRRDKKH